MDIIKLLDEGFAWTAKRVEKVRPEQLDAVTPCTGWDLRGLLNHMLGGMEYCAAAVAGDADPSPDPDPLAQTGGIGDEPSAAFETIARRALAVWQTPGVLERTCAMRIGLTPASVVARLTLTDVVVHGWDIARTVGENSDIPDELAEPLLEINRELFHIRKGMRGAAFADEVAIAGGSASDRLVAFLGRTP